MEFREIGIEDREEVEAVLSRCGVAHCNMAFSDLLFWKEAFPSEICREQGFIIIRSANSLGTASYTLPMGKGDFTGLMPKFEAYALERDYTLSFHVLTPQDEQFIRYHYPDQGITYLRSQSNYIYSRETLVSLHGHHLQSHRNLINQFKGRYSYTYSPLTAADAGECLALFRRWEEQKLRESGVPELYRKDIRDEEMFIQDTLGNFERLCLTGGVIRVDGKMAAYGYGSLVTPDIYTLFIAKGDLDYIGVYAILHQQMAEHLPECVKYMNWEEDMGWNTLRQAKERYCPLHLLHHKFSVPMTELQLSVKALWLRCFTEDTEEDADRFLTLRFKAEDMLSRERDGRLVSMLHIVYFNDFAYLYAIATDPLYRHQGLASGLINEAVKICHAKGFDKVCLIPSGDDAAEWYASLGFRYDESASLLKMGKTEPFSFYEEYDYGTGDPSKDRMMTLGFSIQ